MEPGQADPAERRGAGAAALGESERGEAEYEQVMTEVLEKLRDNQSELNDLGECEVFVCGFRLGAMIMLEVLDGSDKWGEFEE